MYHNEQAAATLATASVNGSDSLEVFLSCCSTRAEMTNINTHTHTHTHRLDRQNLNGKLAETCKWPL